MAWTIASLIILAASLAALTLSTGRTAAANPRHRLPVWRGRPQHTAAHANLLRGLGGGLAVAGGLGLAASIQPANPWAGYAIVIGALLAAFAPSIIAIAWHNRGIA